MSYSEEEDVDSDSSVAVSVVDDDSVVDDSSVAVSVEDDSVVNDSVVESGYPPLPPNIPIERIPKLGNIFFLLGRNEISLLLRFSI